MAEDTKTAKKSRRVRRLERREARLKAALGATQHALVCERDVPGVEAERHLEVVLFDTCKEKPFAPGYYDEAFGNEALSRAEEKGPRAARFEITRRWLSDGLTDKGWGLLGRLRQLRREVQLVGVYSERWGPKKTDRHLQIVIRTGPQKMRVWSIFLLMALFLAGLGVIGWCCGR